VLPPKNPSVSGLLQSLKTQNYIGVVFVVSWEFEYDSETLSPIIAHAKNLKNLEIFEFSCFKYFDGDGATTTIGSYGVFQNQIQNCFASTEYPYFYNNFRLYFLTKRLGGSALILQRTDV